MSISFAELPGWLRVQQAGYERKVDEGMREAARAGAFAAVEGTPVDTGRARSNWNGEIGRAPFPTQQRIYAPGEKLGRGEAGNLQAALEPIYAALQTWRPSTGQVFYLANSVDYIEDLDDGKSPQGSNFSDAAVISAVNVISAKTFI